MRWILWLAGTLVLAATPALVFMAGASDDATASDQLRVGALGLAIAVVLLVAAARGVGAIALAGYAAAVLGGAWAAASGPVFSGDVEWAIYWGLALAGWAGVGAHVLRRR